MNLLSLIWASRRVIVGWVIALCVLGGCQPASTEETIIGVNSVDYKTDFVLGAKKLVETSDTPGVAVAVVKKDGRSWFHGFGFSDLESEQPMDGNTIISIGSVSKTITTAAVMKAVEDGLLDLDEGINSYLPFEIRNPNFPNSEITMRHLLTHTASVQDNRSIYKSDVVFVWGGDSPISLLSFCRDYFTPEGEYYFAKKNFLTDAPGTSYDYANVGFALAAAVLEQATGHPFYEYTRDNIFVPLGMNDTAWRYADLNRPQLGTQYGRPSIRNNKNMQGENFGQWRAYKRYGLTTYPDGGLRTSVSDLSRFLIAIMNDGVLNDVRILESATVSEMLNPQKLGYDRIPNLRPVQDQALGFVYEIPASIDQTTYFVGHNGGDPGTNTFMYFDPKTEIGIIYFTNANVYSDEHIHAIQTIIRSMVVNAEKFFE